MTTFFTRNGKPFWERCFRRMLEVLSIQDLRKLRRRFQKELSSLDEVSAAIEEQAWSVETAEDFDTFGLEANKTFGRRKKQEKLILKAIKLRFNANY